VKWKRFTTVALAAGLVAAAAACSPSDESSSDGPVTVNWWTWDPNQGAAYSQCIPDFEKANPGITVKVSQYNVSDYFTKLTAGFVAGDAPDAFMNSVTYLQSYAGQGQLLALDKYIEADKVDMSQFAIGAEAWKYTDDKQYALPMDWATAAIYYNKDLLTKAGYSTADVDKMSWNPDDGGTFWQIVKRLTVDKKGVRGDQPGFDPKNVATYGLGNIESTGDPFGQNNWGMLPATDGINIPDKNQWATVFNYADPQVIKSVKLIRALSDDGYSPQLNQFSTAGADQIGSGKVAMLLGGTWDASTFAALPGGKVGTAPMVTGSNGKRALMANSNGNNIWAGSKHPDQTWKWVAYQESAACQTKASQYNGSFLPSIGTSMDALAAAQKAKGVDFSVFAEYLSNDELFPSPIYNNGAAITNAMVPQFESYFTGKSDESIFPKMQEQSKELLAKK